jgi:tripartite ATP-independent transporter DctP family solute receptor
MRFGKKLAVVAAAAAIALSAVPAMAVVEIKFGHTGSLEHQYQIGAEQFKKLVEAESKGEIKVNIFPQAQLGGERDLAEGVRMGTIEIASVAAGNLAGFVPELQLFGIPFLFPTAKQVYAVLDGEVGKDIAAIMASKGFVSLAFWEVGFRNMTNNTRPVKTPEDMKGLKIRVQESKIWIQFMNRLGAVATPIPFGELYSALQQKVVDGQENPVATIYSMKFYEVQKYLSLTGHTYEPAHVIANPKWFNGLDPKHQAIILKAAADAAVYQRQTLADKDKERFEVIKKAGVVIEENPDKAAFAKATEDLYKVLADTVPEKLVQKIKDQVAAVK